MTEPGDSLVPEASDEILTVVLSAVREDGSGSPMPGTFEEHDQAVVAVGGAEALVPARRPQ
ncbi:hypothetical protein SSOG_00016 [Streptomyces himastatinicus ATCC 53653]|uniref:Uncharacterized protein n=1 Tax=Streptomyces himastatinicus ATCC 53653 TaxID=457427 RepID=D9WVA6_9ACTN|nr:hypothetical protein [Streptomyces himastatinicus]EFL20304.1 hypothetical protein SSOG_00016 [Streptomyces himastatinicus ATCC 53653]